MRMCGYMCEGNELEWHDQLEMKLDESSWGVRHVM